MIDWLAYYFAPICILIMQEMEQEYLVDNSNND
jgi:hypothetical protein